MTSTVTAEKFASDKQAHYILTLQGVSKDDDNRAEAALALMESMTMREARARITELKAQPKVVVPVVVTVAAPKFKVEAKQWHEIDGQAYKVAKSQSTGKLYAKRRTADGFDFAKGIFYKFNATTVITAATAAVYGRHHERCVFCRLPLDTPESTGTGYGETCAGNQGLPYPMYA